MHRDWCQRTTYTDPGSQHRPHQQRQKLGFTNCFLIKELGGDIEDMQGRVRGSLLNDESQVRVTGIEVTGNKRMHLSYFNEELKDIPAAGCSLRELHTKLNQCTQNMLSSSIFEVVHANLDVHSRSSDNEFDARLKLNVEEKGIPFLRMQSYLNSTGAAASDVGFEVQGALRSPLGIGEMLKVSSVTGQSGSHEVSANYSMPHVLAHRLQFNVTAKASEEAQPSSFTGYKRAVEGVTVELTDRSRRHTLTAEYSLRDEIPQWASVKPNTSTTSTDAAKQSSFWRRLPLLHSMHLHQSTSSPQTAETSKIDTLSNAKIADASAVTLQTAASSVKSSLKYSCTLFDTRSKSICSPHEGSSLQGSIELALPPGTATFMRTEIAGQHHRTFSADLYGEPGLVLSVSGMLGLLRPLWQQQAFQQQSRHQWSYLSDRFYLGGPNSLRGFATHGTGARAPRLGDQTNLAATHDALGGDVKSTLFASLSVPVPVRLLAESKVRAFVFINAGTIGHLGEVLNAASSSSALHEDQPVGNNYHRSSSMTFTVSPLLLASTENQSPKTTAAEAATAAGLHSTAVSRDSPAPQTGSASSAAHLRASVGGGFSIAIQDSMRLEATYSIPIVKAPQDQVKGFQLGVGLTIN